MDFLFLTNSPNFSSKKVRKDKKKGIAVSYVFIVVKDTVNKRGFEIRGHILCSKVAKTKGQ